MNLWCCMEKLYQLLSDFFPHNKIVATFFTAKMIVVEFIIYVGNKTAYAMDFYSPITKIDLLPF